ncbi:MAG: 23S rRNA (uracil(1939)-C(5))-methyltransferase RlmD [Lachnospiraceae bacterium]
MTKNQIVTMTIEDIGADGEGIGKVEGYTLFVKGAVVGDVIRARVLKAKKTYGYAKIEEMLTPSPDRVTPCCAVVGRCGGCQLQQLSYEKQLVYKAQKVKSCLQRIGGIPEETLETVMEPIIGMDEPYHYRNKAQYPVGTNRDGELVLGFYAGHSHNIIDCTDCAIQEPVNTVILETVRGFMKEYHIPAYDEETGKGLVRHILTRVGNVTKEVMVCLILNGRKLLYAEELAKRLKKAVEGFEGSTSRYTLQSVCLNVNTERTNVILGTEILPVYGETYITDAIGEIRYQISPLSFYQVNPKQTVKLYEKALEYADLSGNEVVWDLYCGIGTISLFLAQKAKQVYGVEIVPQAIEDAKRNAALNGITNTEFFVGAAENVMPEKYLESGGTMRADVICVDPPRKGCDESLLDTVVRMEPKRLVYVSCDPATLARDVKYLGERGYEVKKVCPVDQFGHTGHVETVCLLSKPNAGHHIEVEVRRK